MTEAVVWHDVECGSYRADLPLWRELAQRAGGPVVELGAGTGRVALDLAERGHVVTAVDSERELLEELGRRAANRATTRVARRVLDVELVVADARELQLPPRFTLAIAPMQLLQIVGGREGRAAVVDGAARALAPGGLFAAAISEVEQAVAPEDAAPPVPDVGERDGWVYSSLPLDVRRAPGGVAVERLRQVVSPAGDLREARHTQLLDWLTLDELEDELEQQGLRPLERREIPPTADHVGSMVVVCRR